MIRAQDPDIIPGLPSLRRLISGEQGQAEAVLRAAQEREALLPQAVAGSRQERELPRTAQQQFP